MPNTYVTQEVTASLYEVPAMIAATPMLNYLVFGESGIGKTSYIVHEVVRRMNESAGREKFYPVILPCAGKNVEDISVPVPNREDRVLEFFMNEIFKAPRENMVPVICYDEFPKASRPIKNTLMTACDKSIRRIGNWRLPPETIVFMTGNMSALNLNDVVMAHEISRCVVVNIRKPTSDEYIREYMEPNKMHPVLVRWVETNPSCMASFTDPGQADNAMIQNPKYPDRRFVCGRTLADASVCLYAHDKVTSNALQVMLSGTVGPVAAASIAALWSTCTKLPRPSEIINSPDKAKLPDDNIAGHVMVRTMLQLLDAKTAKPFVTYAERLNAELLSAFIVGAFKYQDDKQASKDEVPKKGRYISAFPLVKNWLVENQDLIR